MGSTPYIGSTNIGFVAAAGYTRVESRYGACILQLSSNLLYSLLPTKFAIFLISFVSVQIDEAKPSEKISKIR
jgi:hypothetical protein